MQRTNWDKRQFLYHCLIKENELFIYDTYKQKIEINRFFKFDRFFFFFWWTRVNKSLTVAWIVFKEDLIAGIIGLLILYEGERESEWPQGKFRRK